MAQHGEKTAVKAEAAHDPHAGARDQLLAARAKAENASTLAEYEAALAEINLHSANEGVASYFNEALTAVAPRKAILESAVAQQTTAAATGTAPESTGATAQSAPVVLHVHNHNLTDCGDPQQITHHSTGHVETKVKAAPEAAAATGNKLENTDAAVTVPVVKAEHSTVNQGATAQTPDGHATHKAHDGAFHNSHLAVPKEHHSHVAKVVASKSEPKVLGA